MMSDLSDESPLNRLRGDFDDLKIEHAALKFMFVQLVPLLFTGWPKETPLALITALRSDFELRIGPGDSAHGDRRRLVFDEAMNRLADELERSLRGDTPGSSGKTGDAGHG